MQPGAGGSLQLKVTLPSAEHLFLAGFLETPCTLESSVLPSATSFIMAPPHVSLFSLRTPSSVQDWEVERWGSQKNKAAAVIW